MASGGAVLGAQSNNSQTQPSVTLPTVTVVAQKEPVDLQKLPVSVTAVTTDWLRLGDIRFISDAAIYSPNTFYSDFTARKLVNPRFRGLGSSPANPAITTFIDGVPHLNTNSSSMDFVDVEQVEFARGPQSSLFGRNTLGGLVNVLSARPSLTKWTGGLSVPLGDYDAREIRGNVSGPLGDRVGVGFSLSHAERDGFTVNNITGNDLDSRSATSAKGQLLWTPANWETRVIVSGERARDGDYALNDLAALRETPHVASRDFEGRTDRDIFATTFGARRETPQFIFSSTTGFVRWKTHDLTDIDYTPLPLARRDNAEEDVQFSQEVRFASSPAASIKLSDRAALAWQAGAFLFTQRYEQLAVNSLAPFVASEFIPFAVDQISPDADLDDVGVSLYGQATATLGERLDLTAGARFDHENKKALLEHLVHAGHRAAQDGRCGAVFLKCVAAIFGDLPLPAAAFGVRQRRAGIQGRRIQSCESGRFGGVRRGVCVAPRGRREDDAGGESGPFQRGRVFYRLAGPAAERPDRCAGGVLYLQRRRREEQRI